MNTFYETTCHRQPHGYFASIKEYWAISEGLLIIRFD